MSIVSQSMYLQYNPAFKGALPKACLLSYAHESNKEDGIMQPLKENENKNIIKPYQSRLMTLKFLLGLSITPTKLGSIPSSRLSESVSSLVPLSVCPPLVSTLFEARW